MFTKVTPEALCEFILRQKRERWGGDCSKPDLSALTEMLIFHRQISIIRGDAHKVNIAQVSVCAKEKTNNWQSRDVAYFQWAKSIQLYSLHLCTAGTRLNLIKKCHSRHLVSCPNPYWGFQTTVMPPICFEHCQYAFSAVAAVCPLWFHSPSPVLAFIMSRTEQNEKPHTVSRVSG